MLSKDYRDIVAGLLMMVIGGWVCGYAYVNYDIGTLNSMGPGFFPAGLGLLLAIIGFFIGLPACFRTGTAPKIEFRTLVLVTASTVTFAVTLNPLGIVLATVLAVAISSWAAHDMTWRASVALGTAVALMVWLIFVLGLSMVLPVWPWST